MKARPCLDKIEAYRIPDESEENEIRFNLNENFWGCSRKALRALRNMESLNLYPRHASFVEKISRIYKLKKGNVLITNGADDGIRCIMDALLERNDEILIPQPTFPMYEYWAIIREARIKKIPFNEDLSFPVQRLLQEIGKNTKMIIIVNPNNPTGTSLDKKDLARVLGKAKNSYVILDETYWHFSRKTYVSLIKKFKNLVVLQSFSKAYGLAGLRLGLLISCPQNISNLEKVNLPFPVSSPALEAGRAALEDRRFMDRMLEAVDGEKRFLSKKLKKFGRVYPTDTNFLLVDFGDECKRIVEELKKKNIFIKSLSGYPMLYGFARITVGKRKANESLLKGLEEIAFPQTESRKPGMSDVFWRH